MRKKEIAVIADSIEAVVGRSILNITRERGEEVIRLLAVGDGNRVDKYFLLDDLDAARRYIIKRMDGQVRSFKPLSVFTSIIYANKSDAERLISSKGDYE